LKFILGGKPAFKLVLCRALQIQYFHRKALLK
jgi:hypothetical protein